MAFQSVPNGAEIVITYSGHGQEFKNVLNATHLGGYVLADLVALAVAVDASVAADWLTIQSLDYIYLNTVVRGLEFINDQEVLNSTNTGPGLGAAAALPDNVTLSVKKSSGLTGRGARGRLYWIGTTLTQIATNENQYTTAGAAQILGSVGAMRNAIAATTWVPAIISRYLDGVKRAQGAAFPWISTVLVNNNVDSQRRRLIN